MFKNPPLGCIDAAKTTTKTLPYVETDPSGRYRRLREILGKGAMKTVYKAFDKVLGMEVAWNQVKLNEVFRSPEELQRLYCEVHLLKNLNHDSIIRFYTSWIDVNRRTFNFITEMLTSGTLREYRNKYRRVDIRAVKNWARQILGALVYLHGLDVPVIHRDLKCDNIFVNGHLGQVKIGDLGLAAILRRSQHAHSVIGTPEFMAPELYEEDYNELVDIYSFGMCVLEMLTSEFPYSECSNPAQIYKKVTSGKLPEAFYRIEDQEARSFVGKCLENVSKRLPAKELLLDPFLASDDGTTVVKPISSFMAPDSTKTTDMTITGTMNPEDDTIFLKVKISDKNGQSRNIYFLFDIFSDTATEVALEMVKELEITDWEPLEIAEMIEEEISSLVPNWKEFRGSHKLHHQYSFGYEDEEDEAVIHGHHPFYSNSSYSSSHAFLSYFISSAGNWLQQCEDILNTDDAGSNGSISSLKYSNVDYYLHNEDDFDSSEPLRIARTNKSTRFCPTSSHKQCYEKENSWGARGSNTHLGKVSRIRSMMDIRSQLLHLSLVEEINKRRLFNTVGAIENIGYHEPGNSSNKGDGLYGRCSSNTR